MPVSNGIHNHLYMPLYGDAISLNCDGNDIAEKREWTVAHNFDSIETKL